MTQIQKARDAIRLKGLISRARIDTYLIQNPTHGGTTIAKALGLNVSTVQHHIKLMRAEEPDNPRYFPKKHRGKA